MRKNKVGIILLSLIFVFAFFMLPGKKQVNASANVLYSGSCGNNATWTLDENGVLRISGTGAMYDYDDVEDQSRSPWRAKLGPDYDDPRISDSIKSIVIENGITYVGAYAFCNCRYATSVAIPNGVTKIAYGAFWQCSSLESVSIPAIAHSTLVR